MSQLIELIDIGSGNTGSVKRCLERIGVEVKPVRPDMMPSGEKPIIFPGVGAFGSVMGLLAKNKQDQVLKELLEDGIPYLGICIGLQVLFDSSKESPGVDGLGVIEGEVLPFTEGKIPQIGWNYVSCREEKSSGYAYFVNSFYADPKKPEVVSHSSDYFRSFCAGVKNKNITAYQFHPEKSGEYGESLIKGWLQNVI